MTRRLRVGIVAIAEPLALDAGSRPMRCGMLGHALAEAGHRVIWWTSRFDHATKTVRDIPDRVEVEPGFEVRFLDAGNYGKNISIRRLVYNQRIARAFARVLDDLDARDRPDIFVVSIPLHELARPTIRFGCEHGIPVILDVRDKWPDYLLTAVPPHLRRATRLAMSPWFRAAARNFRRADGITAISQSYLDWALALAGRDAGDQDAVLPIGYQVPRVLVDRERPVGTGSTVRCVYAGTLGHSSDLRAVLDAARHFSHMNQKLRFVLVGDGPLLKSLKADAADLDNVDFLGWIDRSDLVEVLRSSDIGLACYSSVAMQSLPNKPFEYWAAGLPVVESLGGELGEIVERSGAGLGYEAGNARSLVKALGRLLASPEERIAMGRRGRELVESTYNADRIYPQFVSLIERASELAAPPVAREVGGSRS